MLDASALLAYVGGEVGYEMVEDALAQGAHVSAVNWAEVLSKVADVGGSPEAFEERLRYLGILDGLLRVTPFGPRDALEEARVRGVLGETGPPFTSRACLALARRLGLPALTTDRGWGKLADSLGVDVRLVR